MESFSSSRKELTGWGDGNSEKLTRYELKELHHASDPDIINAHTDELSEIITLLLGGLSLSDLSVSRRKYDSSLEDTKDVEESLHNILLKRALKMATFLDSEKS
jgi:hypothetical protein